MDQQWSWSAVGDLIGGAIGGVLATLGAQKLRRTPRDPSLDNERLDSMATSIAEIKAAQAELRGVQSTVAAIQEVTLPAQDKRLTIIEARLLEMKNQQAYFREAQAQQHADNSERLDRIQADIRRLHPREI